MTTSTHVLNADRPIGSRTEDRFGRAPFADALGRQVRALPGEECYVVGLTGPWGYGKTSVLNMLAENLAADGKHTVLWFNPWLFSGTEELTASFLREVAAQLREQASDKLRDAGEVIARYGDALTGFSKIPIIGKYVEGLGDAGKALAGAMGAVAGTTQSVQTQRSEIKKALSKADTRLVVILDDIDRLSFQEIREVFRLVRLTADFPNTRYVLAFDWPRVIKAVAEEEEDGQAYLEKILQLVFEVPKIREPDLTGFLGRELDAAIAGHKHGPAVTKDITNLFHQVIRPLVSTPRDVRRYTNAVPLALEVVGDEVALADLLALEAVRVFLPGVYELLVSSERLLTEVREPGLRTDPHAEADKERLGAILEAAGSARAAVEELLRRVFPPARRWLDNHWYGHDAQQRWRKARRLASPEVLRFYLEKSLPEGALPATTVEEVYGALTDEAQLENRLQPLAPDVVEHLLVRLEVYEHDFPPGAAEVAIPVLCRQVARLREGRRNMFDYGAQTIVDRLVLRLLRRVPTDERDATVTRILAGITTLTQRLNFVELVGHIEKVGHALVSKALAASLEEQVLSEVLDATPEQIAREREPLPLLARADDGSERAASLMRSVANSDAPLAAVLRSSIGRHRVLPLTDVVETSVDSLPWSLLCDLFDGDYLRKRVGELAAASDGFSESERAAVGLAVQYAEGRPPRLRDVDEDEDDDDDGALSELQDVPPRRYRPAFIRQLLRSAVPARRKAGLERVAEMLTQMLPVHDSLVELLTACATGVDMPADERATAITQLSRLRRIDAVADRLAHEWLRGGMDAQLQERAATALEQEPAHLSRLLQGLAELEVPVPEGLREVVGRALQSVARMLRAHSAVLADEDMLSAEQTAVRFEPDENLVAAVNDVRAACQGTRIG